MDPNAKLNEDKVRQIRALAGSMSQREIAKLFSVNQQQISRVITRTQWAWVD